MNRADERNLALELARHSARLLTIAEVCYFTRLCRSGRSMAGRDLARSTRARNVAAGLSLALADDVEALRSLGLAGAAVGLLRGVAREIMEARLAHCTARGLDPRLAQRVALACEPSRTRTD